MTYYSGWSTHSMDRQSWLAAGRLLGGEHIRPPGPRDPGASDFFALMSLGMLRPWFPGEAAHELRPRAARFVRELMPVELAEAIAYEQVAA